MYLSIIVPSYNGAKKLPITLRSIEEYLKTKDYDYEIIVINDGSKDNTAEVVEGLKSEIKNLKLIDNKKNHGKGYVVRQAMLEAVGDLRLFMDDDNSTTIDNLDKMIPYFNSGYGVIIGSIAVEGHKVAEGSEPIWRRIFGKMGNLFIQIMAVPGIHDTQRGFKIFIAEAVKNIFPRVTITGWGFDVEVLALARKFGHKIKEVPVDWKNDPDSNVGLKAYLEVLLETTKIRWNLWTGKYR